jgi:hypothetical protein
MAARYAESTSVPVDRSRGAIEALLHRHGATSFAYGWDATHDRIQFQINGRAIRFLLPKPDRKLYTHSPGGRLRNEAAVTDALRQADRQRWRALFLVIRAKLEAVEAGIAVFEQEFLAFIVLGNDMTVGDIIVPRLGEPALGKLLVAGKFDG